MKDVSSLRWRGRAGGDSHGASRHRGQDNVVSARLCTRRENPEANTKQTREQKEKTGTPDRTARARPSRARIPRRSKWHEQKRLRCNCGGSNSGACDRERGTSRGSGRSSSAPGTCGARAPSFFFLHVREVEVTPLEDFANAWPTRACALPSG